MGGGGGGGNGTSDRRKTLMFIHTEVENTENEKSHKQSGK